MTKTFCAIKTPGVIKDLGVIKGLGVIMEFGRIGTAMAQRRPRTLTPPPSSPGRGDVGAGPGRSP